MKKFIFPVVAIVLVTATAFKLTNNKKEVANKVYRADPEKKVLVQVDTVEMARLNQKLVYTGTFIPNREVLIIPQMHGEVTSVLFREGDHVKQGQRLVQVDDELLQAQYISVEANYETAKRNLERYETASQSGGVSQLQLDTYRLNLKTAESQLKQLAKQIRMSSVEAPFAGTITFKDVEPGAIAGTSPVARVTDLSRLKLEIDVPETEVGFFEAGRNVEIRTDAHPGKILIGNVDYVSDRADGSHNYTVKILVENSASAPVKAGMYGTAALTSTVKKETVTIRRSALIGSAKNPQVFVVQNGVAVQTEIQTGASNEDAIEVVHGLQAGDVVVIGGQINLTSGSKVEAAQ